MQITTFLAAALLALLAGIGPRAGAAPVAPGDTALKAARYAADTYRDAQVDTLARLAGDDSVADPALPCERDPRHAAFKVALKQEAARLGLDVSDAGCVLVIGLGQGPQRIGLVTHGSEAGRPLARGAEDDRGPIASALYAMKSLKDLQLPLSKRIELIVSMAGASDPAPLDTFATSHALPDITIALDAAYPAVTAEKGHGRLAVTLPRQGAVAPADAPWIRSFTGGASASRIPADASAVVANATPALEAQLRQRASRQPGMRYGFAWTGRDLAITTRGVPADASTPEEGVNAISMLAELLDLRTWPDTTAGALVNFLDEMVGTGHLGEKFGNIAYRDAFMGPMTLVPTVIREHEATAGGALDDSGLALTIDIRRPQGKSAEQLSNEINAALAQWQGAHLQLADVQMQIGDPWLQQDAPQLPLLLGVFASFTGIHDPKPVAIGGGSSARLFPHAVGFGPALPHTPGSGHPEHEFIGARQLLLNLEMLTAALAELAK